MKLHEIRPAEGEELPLEEGSVPGSVPSPRPVPVHVLVYGSSWCRHCRQARHSLRQLQLPFTDLDVTGQPALQEWLKGRTGSTTIPQIFFNGHHVGGNSELQAALRDERRWDLLVTSCNAAPHQLAPVLPLVLPGDQDQLADAASSNAAVEPCAAVAQALALSSLPHSSSCLSRMLCRSANNCGNGSGTFTGRDLVRWCSENNNTDSSDAVQCATELLDKKFILAATRQPTFDEDGLYLVNSWGERSALNGGPYRGLVLPEPEELSRTIREHLLQLYAEHLSPDGKSVQYSALVASSQFSQYLLLARELQRASLTTLSLAQRTAFFINIYNAMVVHALALHGPPPNMLQQMRFYSKTTYILGGEVFSLNDIENGVLRGNRAAPSSLLASTTFSSSDMRLLLSLPQADPRIHFALNCGARSCPPITTYTAQNLSAELTTAAVSYLASDEGLQVLLPKRLILVTSLIRWYSSDFGSSVRVRLEWVAEVLEQAAVATTKVKALRQLLDSGEPWKLQWLPYDWGHNGAAGDKDLGGA